MQNVTIVRSREPAVHYYLFVFQEACSSNTNCPVKNKKDSRCHQGYEKMRSPNQAFTIAENFF